MHAAGRAAGYTQATQRRKGTRTHGKALARQNTQRRHRDTQKGSKRATRAYRTDIHVTAYIAHIQTVQPTRNTGKGRTGSIHRARYRATEGHLLTHPDRSTYKPQHKPTEGATSAIQGSIDQQAHRTQGNSAQAHRTAHRSTGTGTEGATPAGRKEQAHRAKHPLQNGSRQDQEHFHQEQQKGRREEQPISAQKGAEAQNSLQAHRRAQNGLQAAYSHYSKPTRKKATYCSDPSKTNRLTA